MYYWTDVEGRTHVLDRRSKPPSPPLFGYQSRCDAVRVPKEGDHFELREAAETNITCARCRRSTQQEQDRAVETAVVEGHLVEIERDQQGRIETAESRCTGDLLEELNFEPTEFTGDLHSHVENVCDACWTEYTEDQWSVRPGGAELAVEVVEQKTGERTTYYAESISTLGRFGGRTRVQLSSTDGLTKEFDREEIKEIQVTRSDPIVY